MLHSLTKKNMNEQHVQTSQAKRTKAKTTWRTGCVCGGGRSHQYNGTLWGSAANLLLLAVVSYHSSFLQIVSVKQNHKPVRENCTSKRSNKWCDAEIKLTHKLELMKIQRINPNTNSSAGLIKDGDKEPSNPYSRHKSHLESSLSSCQTNHD